MQVDSQSLVNIAYLNLLMNEVAADQLARLDTAAALAPNAIALALRAAALAELTQATRSRLAALVAAEADTLLDRALDPATITLRDGFDAGERQARSAGARPRDDGSPLERALDCAARAASPAHGELDAALQLCRDGRTGRVRLLPFAGIAEDRRAAAVAAWREGDTGPWRALGLTALADRASRLRRVLLRFLEQYGPDEARLDQLGRAAINARRVVGLLRHDLAGSMPWVAERLELSRPAASDALERLVASGLVVELTGRARDRVYAYRAAVDVAGTLLSA